MPRDVTFPCGCGGYREDPGPCPVDDTPHTACTPESVAIQKRMGTLPPGTLAVGPVYRPQVLDRMETTFTTGTYRRDLHGPNRPARPKVVTPKVPKVAP